MSHTQFWRSSRDLYRSTLVDKVVPFWMRHGLDFHQGGLSNMLDEAGRVVGTDKFLWSQGRALWTFSALYNRVEARADWLAAATHIFHYLQNHGRNECGHWNYRLSGDGEVLDGDISLYVDGFVLHGLSEYYRATGDSAALDLAWDTWLTVVERLNRPGSYGVAPYAIPTGLKTHGVAMILSYFSFELGEASQRPEACKFGLQLLEEILHHFYSPNHDAILEFVALDGQPVDTPAGRACVPGHALESLWFLISIFERSGREDLIPECCRLIRRHLELAWDREFGGLRLALDIEGCEPAYWAKADYKPWWVQVEALVATAYAARYTSESWPIEWHQRIQSWAWARYPSGHGEWHQWLDKTGLPTASAALPVKDFFHLPRALLTMTEVLSRSRRKKLIASPSNYSYHENLFIT